MILIGIIIILIAIHIFCKMGNYHPFFILDEFGVMKFEKGRLLSQPYIHIDPTEFEKLRSIHSSYFPNGSCEITKARVEGVHNSLFVETSIECRKHDNGLYYDLIFEVIFVIQKIKEQPDFYRMYLFQECRLGANFIKGDIYKGSISDLVFSFENWEKNQIDFIKRNQSEIIKQRKTLNYQD